MERKRFWSLLTISICVLNLGVGLNADSLFNPSSAGIYSKVQRDRQVGDIITIYISEASSAVQQAGTQTSKRSNVGADFLDYWDQVALGTTADQTSRKRQQYLVSGRDSYSGLGKTERKSKVKAVVTAVISEILDNGNYYVVGEHKVKVNEETETIRISGIIRPQDITGKNTVFSHQIANAQVSVKGSGVVAAKQNPGLMTKMLNWLF